MPIDPSTGCGSLQVRRQRRSTAPGLQPQIRKTAHALPGRVRYGLPNRKYARLRPIWPSPKSSPYSARHAASESNSLHTSPSALAIQLSFSYPHSPLSRYIPRLLKSHPAALVGYKYQSSPILVALQHVTVLIFRKQGPSVCSANHGLLWRYGRA